MCVCEDDWLIRAESTTAHVSLGCDVACGCPSFEFKFHLRGRAGRGATHAWCEETEKKVPHDNLGIILACLNFISLRC